MRLKREHVTPGRKLSIRAGHTLILDSHLMLSGAARGMTAGELEVVASPRRDHDGINLVRVKLVTTSQECEVYYCDVLKHCETADAAP